MKLTRLLSLGLGLAATGCYTYRPVATEGVHPGMEVRARVSASQAAELSAYLPNETDRLIEGTVLEAGSSDIFLLVPVAERNVPGRREAIGQRLRLPSQGILELELKELERAKTGVLVAASAVVAGLVLYETLADGGGGEPPSNPDPGPQDVLVLWRVPFGR